MLGAIRNCSRCTLKAKKVDYFTIGVRFVFGAQPIKVYTYRIKKGRKVNVGDILVADHADRGHALVAVVRVDAKPTDDGPFTYKFIDKVVRDL